MGGTQRSPQLQPPRLCLVPPPGPAHGPGGVPAPPAGAGRQSRGGGTGHGAHTLPSAEQEEPFMERERGEGTGRGGRKLKAEPKQKGWREGRELGKNGAQQGSRGAAGMKNGGRGCGHPHRTNEDCGAVPGLCSGRWGKAPAAEALLGRVRLPQIGVLGVHRDPSMAPLPLGKRQRLRPETGPAWEKAGPQMGFD